MNAGRFLGSSIVGWVLPRGRIARALLFKTLTIAIVIGLVTAGGYSAFDYGYQKEMARTGALEALNMTREAAKRATYDLDPVLALTIVDGLAAAGRFKTVTLTDDFAMNLAEWRGSISDSLFERSARFTVPPMEEIVVLLFDDDTGQSLGMLAGTIDEVPIFREWFRHAASSFLLVPLAVLVAAALLAGLFHRSVTHPLTMLAETIKRDWIEDVEPGTLKLPPEHRGNELGVLIETINSASSALRTANAKLREVVEQLHNSESRFRSYFDNAPEGIFVADEAGRYTDVNPAGCALVGHDRENLLNMTVLDVSDPPERAWHWELFSGLQETGRLSAEIALRRKDGSRVYVWLSAVRLADGGVIGFCQDTTERRAYEATLKAAKKTAEDASLAKSHFLANMSHELRTPLNSVIGFSGAMSEQIWGPLPERYLEYARLISQSGEHLLGIIGDLLDMSRIEAGKTQLSLEEVDVGIILTEVLSIVSAQAESNDVRIALAPDFRPCRIDADPIRIRQIFINLLSNAVKFSPHGSVTISTDCDEKSHRIVIADTGIGMNAADIATALQPFGQVESRAETRRFQGTGLGLPLANQLVELHGGRLDIRSKRGEGTTVTVVLPKRAT